VIHELGALGRMRQEKKKDHNHKVDTQKHRAGKHDGRTVGALFVDRMHLERLKRVCASKQRDRDGPASESCSSKGKQKKANGISGLADKEDFERGGGRSQRSPRKKKLGRVNQTEINLWTTPGGFP